MHFIYLQYFEDVSKIYKFINFCILIFVHFLRYEDMIVYLIKERILWQKTADSGFLFLKSNYSWFRHIKCFLSWKEFLSILRNKISWNVEHYIQDIVSIFLCTEWNMNLFLNYKMDFVYIIDWKNVSCILKFKKKFSCNRWEKHFSEKLIYFRF